jgi:integrase
MSAQTGITFRAHTLRRTFSRQLESHEVPLEVISGLMGHSLGVTGHYTAGVGMKRMERALHKIDYHNDAGVNQ